MFQDNVLLINPNIDASDRELHFRNGFKTAGKNLISFLQNNDQQVFTRDVQRPMQFGNLTKDNKGQALSYGSHEHKPTFKIKGTELEECILKSTHSASQLIAPK